MVDSTELGFLKRAHRQSVSVILTSHKVQLMGKVLLAHYENVFDLIPSQHAVYLDAQIHQHAKKKKPKWSVKLQGTEVHV